MAPVMAPDHWCWPNSRDIFDLWEERSERNLFHTSAPLCHEEAGWIWAKTHLPAESSSLNNTEGVCVTASTHPSKRHFVAHVLTSPNPPESQDLIRRTPSPAPPHTPIVCPLWRAPSLASARTHKRGPQKPLPVTLHESLGQRSLVASGLHDNSLVVPRTFHPTTHTHINAGKQLLSAQSCASEEKLQRLSSNSNIYSRAERRGCAVTGNKRQKNHSHKWKVPVRTKPWL